MGPQMTRQVNVLSKSFVTYFTRMFLFTSMCFLRVATCLNFFLHVSQSKGFSPVCIRMCASSALIAENGLKHTRHSKDFVLGCSIIRHPT